MSTQTILPVTSCHRLCPVPCLLLPPPSPLCFQACGLSSTSICPTLRFPGFIFVLIVFMAFLPCCGSHGSQTLHGVTSPGSLVRCCVITLLDCVRTLEVHTRDCSTSPLNSESVFLVTCSTSVLCSFLSRTPPVFRDPSHLHRP